MLEKDASLEYYNHHIIQKITLKIEISKIKIGKRIRQDMGDINGLAESIKVYGLLSPILVRRINENHYKLLAGHRRLEATKLLQHATIKADLKNE